MKKILHVIASMNAGGMETLIMNYYRNIDRSKFQFHFLINEPNKCLFEDEILKLGGKIYRAPYQRKNIIENHKKVREVLKNNNYDIIHMHQGITYYYPLKYAKKIGIKNRIVHNHGINRKFLKYLKLYNNLYARFRISSLGNNFISCSNIVLNHIFSNKIISQKKYSILHNAIDIKKYKYDYNDRIKIRQELKITNETVFIHVGTFTIPKNHNFLIEVFEKNLKYDKKSKLLLIGEGPLKSEIMDIVAKKGIEDNVIFLGVKKNIPAYLSASDIMLFPSLYEGLPLTLIEAQANGINILASNNISKESKITDLIKYLSINDSDIWIHNIKNIRRKNNRKSYNSILLKSDYEIKNAVKKLEEIYSK